MKKSPKIPELRISVAALGRRFATILLLAREGRISSGEFLPTMDALFDKCLVSTDSKEPTEDVNRDVYDSQVREVEKSARRSEAARRAAQKRREAREAAGKIAASPSPVVEQEVTSAGPVEETPADEPDVIDQDDPWWDMSDDDYLLYSGRRRDGRPLTDEEKKALDVRRAVARQLGRYPYRPDPNWCSGSRLLY